MTSLSSLCDISGLYGALAAAFTDGKVCRRCSSISRLRSFSQFPSYLRADLITTEKSLLVESEGNGLVSWPEVASVVALSESACCPDENWIGIGCDSHDEIQNLLYQRAAGKSSCLWMLQQFGSLEDFRVWFYLVEE